MLNLEQHRKFLKQKHRSSLPPKNSLPWKVKYGEGRKLCYGISLQDVLFIATAVHWEHIKVTRKLGIPLRIYDFQRIQT